MRWLREGVGTGGVANEAKIASTEWTLDARLAATAKREPSWRQRGDLPGAASRRPREWRGTFATIVRQAARRRRSQRLDETDPRASLQAAAPQCPKATRFTAWLAI